jgi:Mrp family chromosome partitioning ATPase
MEQLLVAARKGYDYIIVEIAPIMSVVDVKMIERFIDRFIFVAEWGQTKRSLVCVFRARKASVSRHVGPRFHTRSVQCS